MKILVTAFKPFNKLPNNYSMEVLKYIDDVDKLIIDVNYDRCYQEIICNYDLYNYDFIIALGEARMRDELTVESQALNLASCSIPDNCGILKQNETIILDSNDILKTKINLDEISGFVKISNDAGKFVCNNLYYHLLYNHPNKSLFIHIPNCHDNDSEYVKNANLIMKIISVLYSHIEKEGEI